MDPASQAESRDRRRWKEWIAPLLVLVVGLFLVVLSVVPDNLFEVGPAFEDLVDDFRPLLEEEAIASAQSDIASLGAVADEFQNAIVPGLASQLGVAPELFAGLMAVQYPAVATGVAALPGIAEQFTGLIGTLDAQRDLFASADAIPTTSLPATTVPWGIFIAGLVVIAVAAVMFLRRRLGTLLAIGLGLLLIVVPVVLSLPGKAADADDLNANLTPIYTEELVFGANTALAVVGDMANEMQEAMLPALAAQLQLSPEQLQAFLGENFPVTAAALGGLDATMGRFLGLSRVFEANLGNFDVLKPVAFSPVVWSIILSGVAVLLLGLYSAFTGRKAAAASPGPSGGAG